MNPYYQDEQVTIYHGDCREVLPALQPGCIITDPPYPDYHEALYQQTDIECLKAFDCRQFIFWSARADFPLDWTGIHIWDKKIGVGVQYERIFERNGNETCEIFRHYFINSTVAASFAREVFTGHPSQKPLSLLAELIVRCPDGSVVDPFMGSGSTLVISKQLGRQAIGIEVDERYCEMAVKRLAQGALFTEAV